MIRMKTKTKEEFCQSRFYKDWNPDFMADYNRWYGDTILFNPTTAGHLTEITWVSSMFYCLFYWFSTFQYYSFLLRILLDFNKIELDKLILVLYYITKGFEL